MSTVKLSTVLSALSYALDHTEGQPLGHHRSVDGESLSTHARIMATADIFDALSAERPYRGAMPLEQVLNIIQEGRGTQLCPDTVDAVMAVAGRNSAALMRA